MKRPAGPQIHKGSHPLVAPSGKDDLSGHAHRQAIGWLGFFLAPLVYVFSSVFPVPCLAEEGKLYVLELPKDAVQVLGREGKGATRNELRLKAPTAKEIERLKAKFPDLLKMEIKDLRMDVKGEKWLFFVLEKSWKDERIDTSRIIFRKPTQEEMEEFRRPPEFSMDLHSPLRELEVGIGLGGPFPLGGRASDAYVPAFGFSMNIGFKHSDHFSVLVEVIAGRQDSINGGLTGWDGHSFGALSLLGKFRVPTGPARPFLTVGLGPSYDRYLDYDDSMPGLPASEVSFCLQTGLGLEIPFEPARYFFLEGRLVSSFISRSFADIGYLDTPSVQVFLQGGLLLGR